MHVITATELPRFIACNGSKYLDKVVEEPVNSVAVDEGNAAHWLIEKVFKGEHTIEELIDRKAPNNHYITFEMAEHCSEFLDIIQGLGQVETDRNYTGDTWEVRGRSDHDHYDPVEKILYINDYKYGYRIVEPVENYTLISHAISFILTYGIVPEKINMSICQPRPYHARGTYRTWSISYQEFLQYQQKVFDCLSNPQNILNTGSHCYKCKAFTNCPAAQKSLNSCIDVSESVFNSNVPDWELSKLITTFESAEKKLKQATKAYKEEARARLKSGRKIPEYSLETDLANTSWKDGIDVDTVLLLTGIDASVKKSLVTPNQAIALGIDENIVKSLTERKNKGVKLVKGDANKKAEHYFTKPTERKQ